MKKIITTILALVLTLSLMGCPPVYNPEDQFEGTPLVEAMFQLPQDAYFTAESFDFTISPDEEYFFPSMKVHASYTIQNDGEEALASMLIPQYQTFEIDSYDLVNNTIVKVNDTRQDLSINFGIIRSDQALFTNLTYSSFAEEIISDYHAIDDVIVYKYVFKTPTTDTTETLLVTIPYGAFFIADRFISNQCCASTLEFPDTHFSIPPGIIDIDPYTEETYGTFFTLYEEATFDGNFDYELTSEIISVTDIIEDYRGHASMFPYYFQQRLYEFMQTGANYILDLASFVGETEMVKLMDLYTLDVPLAANSTTSIDITYFSTVKCGSLKVENDIRYLRYYYYLDSNRYYNADIPVSFTVTSDYPFYFSNYNQATEVPILVFNAGYHFDFIVTNPTSNDPKLY